MWYTWRGSKLCDNRHLGVSRWAETKIDKSIEIVKTKFVWQVCCNVSSRLDSCVCTAYTQRCVSCVWNADIQRCLSCVCKAGIQRCVTCVCKADIQRCVTCVCRADIQWCVSCVCNADIDTYWFTLIVNWHLKICK